MDDIIGELKNFLSTEEGQKTAEAINEMLNGEKAENDTVSPPDCGLYDLGDILGKIGKSGTKNESTALISALMPFLSEKRKTKAQKAVKILGAITLLPALQESGILSSLF